MERSEINVGALVVYTLRRTWENDPEREDFVIRRDDSDVGRVYLTKVPEGLRFVWSIYMDGRVSLAPGVANRGAAITLDEAIAAFKQSYEAMRAGET